jgi:acetyl-CoA carboxylase biotin carboxyl carrier protein
VLEQTVELLAGLDRPPRTLRVQAGAVAVDITWPDGGGGHPAAPGAAAEPLASGQLTDGPLADGVTTDHLRSPAVGVFYHAREPGAAPFVSVGDLVRPGQQVGIVEAMKLMIPVEAALGGRVSAVLKANGQPVEYDEPLFALALDAAGDAGD